MKRPGDKSVHLEGLEGLRERLAAHERRVVLCHGCFDVLHPGHVGHLEVAAARGEALVVSVTSDDAVEKADGTRPHLPEELRAEHLARLGCVDHVVVCAAETALPVIERLRPALYVKGGEYAESGDPRVHAERAAVERHGGRVLFSSGEVVRSSTRILASGGVDTAAGEAQRLRAACGRWGVSRGSVAALLGSLAGLRLVVVGDALTDRYAVAAAAEPAAEGPVLTVRPERVEEHAGGAAAIAAHAAALGARVTLVYPAGVDAGSGRFADRLATAGVEPVPLPLRPDLPVKERFVVGTQKLLKVDHGRPAPLDSAGRRRLLDAAAAAVGPHADALIATDFGLGCLDAGTAAALFEAARPRVRVLAGDVSGRRPSLAAMRGADLLAPNEAELRAASAASDASLPSVAFELMRGLGVRHLLATLDARGAVLFHPRDPAPGRWFEHRLRSDHVPSLAAGAVDPVGAGDAMLTAATLALAAGVSGPRAAYLGSLAAAVAVGRLGNASITLDALRRAAGGRGELLHRHPPATPPAVGHPTTASNPHG